MRLDQRQAGAQIEITPAMIDAGVAELEAYHVDWLGRGNLSREAVLDILNAALRVPQEDA